jgi:hypothetical protein
VSAEKQPALSEGKPSSSGKTSLGLDSNHIYGNLLITVKFKEKGE